MSPAGSISPAEPPCDCPGARSGADGGQAHYRRGPDGLEPVPNLAGEGPCCDAPRWPRCGDCPHFPEEEKLRCEMEEARPDDAPSVNLLGEPSAVEACQAEAFEAGDEDWWRYGADWKVFERDARGTWRAVEE